MSGVVNEKAGARDSSAESVSGTGKQPSGNGRSFPGQQFVFLVDASNVAHGKTSSSTLPKIENLKRLLGRLQSYPVRVVAIADASLRHKIDLQSELEAMMASGLLEQVPAGTSADDFLWQLWKSYTAEGSRAYIVTNDRFPSTNAAAESRTETPRVAYMFIGTDLMFQPPIEVLLADHVPATPKDKPNSTLTPPAQPKVSVASQPNSSHEVSTDLTPISTQPKTETRGPSRTELVDGAIEVIASLTEPSGGGVRRVNFATVSHELHQRFQGDFVAKFELSKPKDLAEELAHEGLVTLSHTNTTLYVEPTPVFEMRIFGRGFSRRRVAQPDVREGQTKNPAEVPHIVVESAISEHALPEVIEVSAGAPAPIVEIGDPETFLRLARDHHVMHIFHWPCGVYSNEYRSRFRNGGEFFFTSTGTSFRLWGRAYRTVGDFLAARRHGFRGSDREGIVGDRYGNEGVPAIHRELEELVDPHRDGFVPQEGDVYYCARAAGFDDFAAFLADREGRSREDSRFRYA
jgi:hypothetical protein